jgi:hypothetical protein
MSLQAANTDKMNAKSVKRIYSLAMIAWTRLQFGAEDGRTAVACATIRIQ